MCLEFLQCEVLTCNSRAPLPERLEWPPSELPWDLLRWTSRSWNPSGKGPFPKFLFAQNPLSAPGSESSEHTTRYVRNTWYKVSRRLNSVKSLRTLIRLRMELIFDVSETICTETVSKKSDINFILILLIDRGDFTAFTTRRTLVNFHQLFFLWFSIHFGSCRPM